MNEDVPALSAVECRVLCLGVANAVSNVLGGPLCLAQFDPLAGRFLVQLEKVDMGVVN